MKCCLCGKELVGYGNNAEPIENGMCCDDCNMNYVIPIRIVASKHHAEEQKQTEKQTETISCKYVWSVYGHTDIGLVCEVYKDYETARKVIFDYAEENTSYEVYHNGDTIMITSDDGVMNLERVTIS